MLTHYINFLTDASTAVAFNTPSTAAYTLPPHAQTPLPLSQHLPQQLPQQFPHYRFGLSIGNFDAWTNNIH